MLTYFRFRRLLALVPVALAFFVNIATCQDSSSPLLRLQRSKAYLNLETNVVHGQGMMGITYGKSGDVFSYPNSLSCLVVHGDGRFVIEKRDEATLGKPKIKLVEGTLAPDDLQHLKGILDDEAIQKIVTPKPPTLPENAEAVREIESIDAQIDRAGKLQRFTTIKERVKLGATPTSGVTNGMDTYFDNGQPFQKALNPLLKWFEGLEKKSKSDFKNATPQYCAPMNIG